MTEFTLATTSNILLCSILLLLPLLAHFFGKERGIILHYLVKVNVSLSFNLNLSSFSFSHQSWWWLWWWFFRRCTAAVNELVNACKWLLFQTIWHLRNRALNSNDLWEMTTKYVFTPIKSTASTKSNTILTFIREKENTMRWSTLAMCLLFCRWCSCRWLWLWWWCWCWCWFWFWLC